MEMPSQGRHSPRWGDAEGAEKRNGPDIMTLKKKKEEGHLAGSDGGMCYF